MRACPENVLSPGIPDDRVVRPTDEREPASESSDPSQSIKNIRFILGRIGEEAPSGVRAVLAHQGTRDFLGPRLNLSSTMFCQFADVCIDIDDVLPIRFIFFPTVIGVHRAKRP